MTPDERQLVTELFDRLATLEDAPRDPDAERAIRDGLAQAPNAVYALVQTALVQDEVLKRANARIQELEAQLGIGNEPPRQGGFLDNMRDSIFGRRTEPRGSVPSVRTGDAPMGTPPGFGGGQPMGGPGYGPQGQLPPERGRGGSFLGTAAAAAAGVIGGSLLLDGIRSMSGGRQGGFGMTDPAAAAGRDSGSPWGGGGRGSDELARQAGIDDIGRSGGAGGGGPFGQRQGAFGNADERTAGDEGRFEDVNLDDSNLDIDDSGDLDSGFSDE